jgi:hypothetical protein
MQEFSSIHIPRPCHEDWSHMSPAEQGRHCAKCAKVVRDFTGMDRTAVIAAIAAAPAEVCGRVDADLVAPFPLPAHALVGGASMTRLRLFFLALVAAFGWEVFGFTAAQAQTVQPAIAALQDPQILRAALDSLSETEVVLYGRVEDVYTREAVAYAHLMAYEGDTLLCGTLSDAEGNFVLRFPKDKLKGEQYDLRLRYLGRERRDHGVHRDATEFLYLVDASMMVDGMAIVADRQHGFLVGDLIYQRLSFPQYNPTQASKTLYRPLDEWLMMHYSEIHHGGRW